MTVEHGYDGWSDVVWAHRRSLQEEESPETNASTSTATTTTTTTSTTKSCEDATTACECASLEVCGWAINGAGTGTCTRYSGDLLGVALVECIFCPSQLHCPGQGCRGETDPCSCAAAPQGCRWLGLAESTGGCDLREPGDPETSCELCPSQPRCVALTPHATSFEPADAGVHEGGFASVQVRMWFDQPMGWCSDSSASTGMELSCDGLAAGQGTLSFTSITLNNNVLRADVSRLVERLDLNSEIQCGLIIERGSICSMPARVPFAGLSRGSYSFIIQDSVPPALTRFEPMNGATNAAVNGAAEFFFDEPVFIGEQEHAIATLGELEVGRYSGAVTSLGETRIPLVSPDASVDGKTLRLQLNGRVKPDFLYTISVPEGAVVDRAGNKFLGLLPRAYTFRTSAVAPRNTGNLADSEGGISLVGVVAIVTGIVAVLLVFTIGAIRVLRGRAAHLAHLSKVPSVSRVVPKPAKPSGAYPQPGQWTADDEPPFSAAAGPSMSESSVPPSSAPPGSVPVGPAEESNSWAYRAPGARAAAPKAQPGSYGSRVHPARPAAAAPPGGKSTDPRVHRQQYQQQQQQKRQQQQQQQEQQAQQPPAAQQEEASSPEVQAVQKRMRGMMDEPLAVRKKTLKDLMLEFHPDKNSEAHAKEVFQYVNNAKGWFLQG